jgi:allophanate hydrolase
VSGHPLLREVDAEPVAVNAALGRYTHFCNLLDLCAIAVPAGDADGGPFGVTIFGPPFHDRLVADVAGLVVGERIGERAPAPGGIPLAVFGAHLTGQPLNSQLVGARLEREITTASGYALYALDTEPPKPGLLRVEHQPGAITGELWRLPPTTLAALLADLPSPMTLGQVELADGSSAVGFLCESAATVGAENITGYGSWASYLGRHRSSANSLTSANVLADVVEDDRTELGGTFEMDGVGSVGD